MKVKFALLNVLVCFFTFALNASASFELPEVQNNPQSIGDYKNRLVVEAPWTASQIGYFDRIGANTALLAAQLSADPLFQKLAAERHDGYLTMNISEVQKVQQLARRAKEATLNQWRTEIKHLLTENNAALLDQKILESLKIISNRGPRSIVTGLINCLPPQMRGEFFKIASASEVAKKLSDSPELSDEAIKANFRGEALGLSQDHLTKAHLLQLIEAGRKLEAQLSGLLRARWFLEHDVAGGASLEQRLSQASDASLDPFDAPAQEYQDYVERLMHLDQSSGRELNPKKVSQILSKVKESQLEKGDYEERMSDVDQAVFSFRVVEVPPEIGATRGYLMEDCATDGYGFSYSPAEYNFLVYDEKGTPVGFIGATKVLDGNKKTLFIHDFGGKRVTEKLIMLSLHALHMSLGKLGFDQMSGSSANGNYGDWTNTLPKLFSNANLANHTYVDGPLRESIQRVINYVHANSYDMANAPRNRSAGLFQAIPAVQAKTRAEVSIQGAGSQHPQIATAIPQSKPEAVLRAIDLYNANPEQGITAQMLAIEGVQAQDLRGLIRLLENPDKLPLGQYYEGLGQMFSKFGINFSGKFMREHGNLFWIGHLNAPDAARTTDEALANRTVEYTVNLLKRGEKYELVSALLEQNREFFLKNEKFQKYLGSFVIRGAKEPGQVELLIRLRFNLDRLIADQEALLRLLAIENPATKLWAVQHLSDATLRSLSPADADQVVHLLSVDDDATPLVGVRALEKIRPHSALAIKELTRSVKYEDNREVLVRAALILHSTGNLEGKALERFIKYSQHSDIPPELRKPVADAVKQIQAHQRSEVKGTPGVAFCSEHVHPRVAK